MRKRPRWAGTINGPFAQFKRVIFSRILNLCGWKPCSCLIFFSFLLFNSGWPEQNPNQRKGHREEACVYSRGIRRTNSSVIQNRNANLFWSDVFWWLTNSQNLAPWETRRWWVTVIIEHHAEFYHNGCYLSSIKQRLMVSSNGQTFEITQDHDTSERISTITKKQYLSIWPLNFTLLHKISFHLGKRKAMMDQKTNSGPKIPLYTLQLQIVPELKKVKKIAAFSLHKCYLCK